MKSKINKKMQSKISAFFKPKSPEQPRTSEDQVINFDAEEIDLSFYDKPQPHIRITYSRRVPNPDRELCEKEGDLMDIDKVKEPDLNSHTQLMPPLPTKTLNKKRSYGQFHLELGQSDFLLRLCSICGLKYTPGEEGDEKVHKTFHMNYTHGIPFKGWNNERSFHKPKGEGDRIIIVLDGDPPAQRNKVQAVVKMMETELGDGWISHKLFKVYMFISAQRVAGCLVAEPIEVAFKAISCADDARSYETDVPQKSKSYSTIIQCGNVQFQREVKKRTPLTNGHGVLDNKIYGASVSINECVPAVCGIRAIWVTPSNRRKHIATQLLDAVRKSFCMGLDLGKSQIAFSQPTSAGIALASRYTGTGSFLIYKSRNLGC